METILVDTSVWINFFNGTPTSISTHLKTIIPTTRLATCPTIVQEILQGARTEKDFKNLVSFFEEMARLSGSQYELSIEAALLYRKLRNIGITIRKPNDCLIAVYAIKNKLLLLHEDKDFDFIAAHSELQIVTIP